MAYLTYDQYKKMNFSKVPEKKFDEFERYAEIFFDQITMDYYQLHDIEEDTDLFRVTQFRKAMALEIEYLHSTGTTSLAEAINTSPAALSVGRMSLTMQNSGSGSVGKTMISIEAYRTLFRTGLLYRGDGGL